MIETLNFLIAHNLVLSSKVQQELGKLKDAVTLSTKSYQYLIMLDSNELAVNGSIFAYSNLAKYLF